MANSNLTKRIKSNGNGSKVSGANALGLLSEAIADMDDSGDWTNVAWCIVSQDGVASQKRMTAIVESVCGVEFVKNSKQPTGLKAKKGSKIDMLSNDVGNRRMLLSDYVVAKVSYRSKELENDDGLPALLVATVPTAWVIEKALKTLITRAVKEGYTFDSVSQAADIAIALEVAAAELNA